MKLVRERKYVINMGNYESFTTGCQVEVNEEDYTIPIDVDTATYLNTMAEQLMTQALAADLKEAAEVSGVSNTFILTMEL